MSVSAEILVVAALILANGVFAMAEIAVVSSRRVRLQRLAQEGSRGARAALELSSSPDRFLATVQVGITLVGILAGAYGGARLAEPLAARLEELPLVGQHAPTFALALVVALITYGSLIFGELVPKRLALGRPESLAALLARPMRSLSRLAAPVVSLLSMSTSAVMKLIPLREPKEAPVTEEEIRMMIAHGTAVGVVHEREQELMENVFRLGDRRINQLMTPRSDVSWLDINASAATLLERIVDSGHSQLPVCDGEIDNVVGMVWVKDLLPGLRDGRMDLAQVMREAVFVPETARALRLPDLLRTSGTHAAVVIDEYGGVQGVVTLADVLHALIGVVPEEGEQPGPEVRRRDDGSWLIDGVLPVHRLIDLLGLRELPGVDQGHYQTAAGFVLHQLRRVPAEGDAFEFHGFRVEVIDMDGNRIDKLLISAVPPPAATG